MVKWPLKALFSHLGLADPELAATRSYRQIEAMSLLLRGIQKALPGHSIKKSQLYNIIYILGKFILLPIFNITRDPRGWQMKISTLL